MDALGLLPQALKKRASTPGLPRPGLRLVSFALAVIFLCPAGANTRLGTKLERITHQAGLSNQNVRCILQDGHGFIWVGTEGGLHRFDGFDFDLFRPEPGNPSSISSDSVQVLYEDRAGRLWIGTSKGLNLYDHSTGRFVRIPHDEANGTLIIRAIREDATGQLWIGGMSGLARYDHNQKRWIPRAELPKPAFEEVWCLLEDRRGSLWVGTGADGLIRYNLEAGTAQCYTRQAGGISHNSIRALQEDREGLIWIGTYGGGLNSFNPRSGAIKHYRHRWNDPRTPSHNVILALLEDREGRLWVGTYGGGLNRKENDLFLSLTMERSGDEKQAANNIWSLFEDRTGQLWIGSSKGLHRYHHGRDTFGYHHPDGKDVGSVTAISANQSGRLWIGSQLGLSRWDPERASAVSYLWEPGDSSSISNDEVWCLYEDASSRLWIGTLGGLNRYEPKTDNFTRFYNVAGDPTSLSHDTVSSLHADAAGNLWVGTYGGGLNRFKEATNTFTRFKHDARDPNSLSHNSISVLYLDPRQRFWVGTHGGGLNEFFPGSGSFIRYSWDRSRAESLSNDEVLSLYGDQAGNLWIGTRKGGLNRFLADAPGDGGAFSSYRMVDGLPSNSIHGIQADRAGRLWLSTDKGLCLFDPITEDVQTYHSRDGLQGDEFRSGASFRRPDGTLYFGGANGLNAFDPSAIHKDTTQPRMLITDFLLFNRSVALRDEDADSPLERLVTETESLTLEPRQNVFTFEFVAFHYAAPEHNSYAYQLAPFDKDWIHTNPDKRSATYTNLPPGHYTFRVKGANKDGVWSENPASIKLRVKAPPWRTSWAIAAYVLLLGWAIFQTQRLARERRHAEQEHLTADQERLTATRLRQLDKLKDEFLANTSHELRTPLNGIIGLTESVMAGAAGPITPYMAGNLNMVISSARQLSNLVNDILDFSTLKKENTRLNLGPVSLHKQVYQVLSISRSLLGDKELTLVNEISPHLPFAWADGDRVQQILTNLVENAIKFTESGQITLSAQQQGSLLEVQVQDTGIGIPEEKYEDIFESFEQADGSAERVHGGTGLGLAITRQLVELNGGAIRVTSVPREGSRFIFTLPAAADKAELIEERGTVTEITAEQNAAVMLEPESTQVENEEPRESRFHILIIDDEPINRQVLVNLLAPRNYRLSQAPGGAEALRAIASGTTYDLILVDVMMPKISGYEVCAEIRKSFTRSELPVIFVTARDQLDDLQAGFDAGGNDFLTKPVSKAELLIRVATHLELLHFSRDLENMVQRRTQALHDKSDEVILTQRLPLNQEKMVLLGTLATAVAGEINRPAVEAHDNLQQLSNALEKLVATLSAETNDGGEHMAAVDLEKELQALLSRVHSIQEGTYRVRTLVRNLHDAALPDGGPVRGVSFPDQIKATLGLIRPNYEDRITFECLVDGPLLLSCRPAELSQIFLNLLSYGCQAILARTQNADPDFQGKITIRGDVSGNKARICFEDNGVGIPSDMCETLFDSSKASQLSSGYGLAAAWGIVQRAGGDLKVTSDLDQGATFILHLPLFVQT